MELTFHFVSRDSNEMETKFQFIFFLILIFFKKIFYINNAKTNKSKII